MSDMIEIIPLVGIIWNEERICFLDSKDMVIAMLGEPRLIDADTYFYDEIKFVFDNKGKVEFIEFLAGIKGKLQPEIYGVNAFGTDAAALYELLKDKNNGDIDDRENGYSYGFLNTSVGVYRPSTPDSVADMIEEAEDEGDPMDAEDIEYEMQIANHWATIGIGVKGYYQ